MARRWGPVCGVKESAHRAVRKAASAGLPSSLHRRQQTEEPSPPKAVSQDGVARGGDCFLGMRHIVLCISRQRVGYILLSVGGGLTGFVRGI